MLKDVSFSGTAGRRSTLSLLLFQNSERGVSVGGSTFSEMN
jgi:hypothetical protein